ncbi:DUF7523 family protein [Natronosalvus vescus]|uniref:DUF7523 family protein n=1 Tax=Natronosalvus vescus TaxID=2953881 RepID=UPI0020905483|nr:hypothetical protein [Natronosalvus vescus]
MSLSLAAETRQAVDAHPFLRNALRAGVLNYTAAARFLAVDGDVDAVATALRRYADDLESPAASEQNVRVRMQSGVGPVDDPEKALVSIGTTTLGTDGLETPYTAILTTGEVGSRALATALETLSIADIDVIVAGGDADSMVLVVDRLEGANAVRAVEQGLESMLE